MLACSLSQTGLGVVGNLMGARLRLSALRNGV